MTLSDIEFFTASAIAFYSAALLWIRYTDKGAQLFDFERAFSVRVAMRIAFLHAAVAVVCCMIGNMTARELILPLSIYLIAVVISLLLLRWADILSTFEPSLIILGPALVIWISAWALGGLILAPARRPMEHDVETSQLNFPPLPISESQIENGTIVVVVSPLKPFGYIELDGQRLPARCIDFGFVGTGEQVQLHSRAGQTVTVKRIATNA